MASDTKFTPGPWSADDVDDESGEINVISCSRPYVCVVLPGAIHGLTEANARLIAAAPELYEALVGLLARAEIELVDPEDVHEVVLAKATISKARGEA